jgi:hypothetical protein
MKNNGVMEHWSSGGMSTGKEQSKEWEFLKNREWTVVITCEKELKLISIRIRI